MFDEDDLRANAIFSIPSTASNPSLDHLAILIGEEGFL
jgi:hypothetical protein